MFKEAPGFGVLKYVDNDRIPLADALNPILELPTGHQPRQLQEESHDSDLVATLVRDHIKTEVIGLVTNLIVVESRGSQQSL